MNLIVVEGRHWGLNAETVRVVDITLSRATRELMKTPSKQVTKAAGIPPKCCKIVSTLAHVLW